MAEDLAEFERWLGRIVDSLEPAKRRRAALKLGQALRRANAMRIAANVEPDGSAMTARKPREEQGRGRPRRMFRRLRNLRQWTIDATADGVEISPAHALAGQTAAVHHFGETGYVGRLRDGRVIRTKYPERRLLGIGREDELAVLDTAAALLDPDA